MHVEALHAHFRDLKTEERVWCTIAFMDDFGGLGFS